jgi:2',3'-cyclic-nucleotide 2'-phosphodiesterase/3'-nucleotidase
MFAAMRYRLLPLFLGLVAPLWAREVPLTILHTTDLHGNLLPVTDYDGHTNVGGLARCATVIREVRAQERNVLLVDAGDTIQGSAVSWLSGGQVMVRALNHLRYDAWVLGNHEFDWGLGKLTNCLAQARMPVLAANLTGLTNVLPYVMREVDGVKVAVIGLTTPGIPNWSRPRLLGGLTFADSVTTLRALIPALRKAGAQVLVLVVHQGFKEGGDDHANQVIALARNFPELDAVIGAHSHRDRPELKLDGMLYTQAAYHGIVLGRVDLVFDTDQRRVTRRSARTMPMDGTVALDAEVLTLARTELAQTEKHLATVLGEATGEFHAKGAPHKATPVHELVCAAIAEAVRTRGGKVDAVLHGVLNPRATIQPGPVTMADVWQLVPYENTVGVVELTPEQWREILDENDGAAAKPEFRLVWPRVRVSAPSGREAVAFNSYDLASGGLRWPKLRAIVNRPDTRLTEYDWTTREAVAEYIRRQGKIAPR